VQKKLCCEPDIIMFGSRTHNTPQENSAPPHSHCCTDASLSFKRPFVRQPRSFCTRRWGVRKTDSLLDGPSQFQTETAMARPTVPCHRQILQPEHFDSRYTPKAVMEISLQHVAGQMSLPVYWPHAHLPHATVAHDAAGRCRGIRHPRRHRPFFG